MESTTSFLSGCFECLTNTFYTKRASFDHMDSHQIELLRASYPSAFRRGLVIGIGPSLYYKENFLRSEDGRMTFAVDDVFRKYIEEESAENRCDLLDECKLTVCCCPIEAISDCVACVIDCFTAPFFGCRCNAASLNRKNGCFFIGAGTGNCLKIGSDALLCIMSCAYLSTRCCCFEATDCVKCKIIPFPVVAPFFWHEDIRACCNGQEMPSDIALSSMLEKARSEQQKQQRRAKELEKRQQAQVLEDAHERDGLQKHPHIVSYGGMLDHSLVATQPLPLNSGDENEDLDDELLAIRGHKEDTQSMQGLPGSRSNSRASTVQRLSPVFINLPERKQGSPSTTATTSADHHIPEVETSMISDV